MTICREDLYIHTYSLHLERPGNMNLLRFFGEPTGLFQQMMDGLYILLGILFS